MKKIDLVKKLCNIGFHYSAIMGRTNIEVIFNYLEFLSNFADETEIPTPPSITNILEIYEI